MPADYKSYSSKKKNKGKSKDKKNLWLWLSIAVGIIAIVLIVLVSINKNQPLKKPVKKILHKSAVAAKKVQKEVQNKLTQPQEVKFEFYNLLPKEKVTVPGNNTPNTPVNKQPPVSQARYLLQVASLKKFPDADTMKAQLIMKGFAAQVKKITVKGNTWFRVQIGPFVSMDAALDAQNKLRKDNHDAIIRKIKAASQA